MGHVNVRAKYNSSETGRYTGRLMMRSCGRDHTMSGNGTNNGMGKGKLQSDDWKEALGRKYRDEECHFSCSREKLVVHRSIF